jgi:DNA-binding transcriptional ArsR family regulator
MSVDKWTFLTSHAIVLFFLTKHPLITGRELAGLVGITERRVRNIISDLDSAGYIKKSQEGRKVRYKTNLNLPFRHPTQKGKLIRILLEALDQKQIRKGAKKQKTSSKGVL